MHSAHALNAMTDSITAGVNHSCQEIHLDEGALACDATRVGGSGVTWLCDFYYRVVLRVVTALS
jgi:hypothetical protein